MTPRITPRAFFSAGKPQEITLIVFMNLKLPSTTSGKVCSSTHSHYHYIYMHRVNLRGIHRSKVVTRSLPLKRRPSITIKRCCTVEVYLTIIPLPKDYKPVQEAHVGSMPKPVLCTPPQKEGLVYIQYSMELQAWIEFVVDGSF